MVATASEKLLRSLMETTWHLFGTPCGVTSRSIKGFPRMWNILSHVPWARDHSFGSKGPLDYASTLCSVSPFWPPSDGAAMVSFVVCTAEPHLPGWSSVPGPLTNPRLETPVMPVAGLILPLLTPTLYSEGSTIPLWKYSPAPRILCVGTVCYFVSLTIPP